MPFTNLAPPAALIACLAGLAASASAHAEPVPAFRLTTATPRAVYVNPATGERVISDASSVAFDSRSSSWVWSNAVADPCAPTPGDASSIAVYPDLHDEEAGDQITPDGIRYWHEWFEHPGDSIIDGISFHYFTQIEDPGLAGVEGFEFLLVFTEEDSPATFSSAVAHSPVVVTDLLGAEDTNGDGTVDFDEGNIWLVYLDLGGSGTDIEVGDTNGVSDGNFGDDSVFSGRRGLDLDGDGLINSGFAIGFRQPGVAEGDGLIDRFLELSALGIGLENPDGLDPDTFPNIRPVGIPLMAPSANVASYADQSGGPISEWPTNPGYLPEPGEGVGAWDAVSLIDAIGLLTSPRTLAPDFFSCQDPPPPSAPYFENPWTGCGIQFNVFAVPTQGCTDADVAEPFGILDLRDINAFLDAFLSGDPLADIGGPAGPGSDGVLDLLDINRFVTSFLGGCP
jgi:hypothetical protein